MGVEVSSATEQALVFLLSILFLPYNVPLFSLVVALSLCPLLSVMRSLILCFSHFIRALFFCSLCPSTSAPLPSLSLPRRHTYTDNTAATCCFSNILQQAGKLHCSPLTQQPFLLWPQDETKLFLWMKPYPPYHNQAHLVPTDVFQCNLCHRQRKPINVTNTFCTCNVSCFLSICWFQPFILIL